MKFLRKLLNLLIKDGKKTKAVKTVNSSIEKLRKLLPPSRLERLFSRIVPGVKIYKKKVAGKVYQIPAIISETRSLFQTAKWITTAVKTEKKGKKLNIKLCKVIWETAKKKGTVWKLRKEYLAIIKENRSYMRFIKKKKKKKIKKSVWVFQQRFTNKVIRKTGKDLDLEKNNDKKINTASKKYRRKNSRKNNFTKKIKFNKKAL